MQAVKIDEGAVLARFRSRTRNSEKLFAKAGRVTPGGVSAGIKFFEPYPVFMKRAKGSRVWDVDGNEYVDYLMSYGALILGHGASVVGRSVKDTLDSFGTSVFGTPTESEFEYGARLRDIYHPGGMMRFTNSGLEATLLAVRLARGHTGRKKVAKFEGHYHGSVDRLLFSYTPSTGNAGRQESPVPIADSIDVDDEMLAEALVLPFNDWASTEGKLVGNAKELACVIIEPFEEGVIPGDRGFMAKLRKLTRDLRIPLIYDEVKTGFRVRFGGATEYYSTVPDLACLGKIIGGGLPIGAVIGDADILGLLDPRRDVGSRVFHSGTFNGNPMSVSVGQATVEALGRPGEFDSLVAKTNRLKLGVASILKRRGVPNYVAGEGAMFNVYITDRKVRNYRDTRASDLRFRKHLDLELISRGVYLKPENRYCLSLAHSDDDVRMTLETFQESVDAILS